MEPRDPFRVQLLVKTLFILIVVTALAGFAKAPERDQFVPAVPLEEALKLAKEYVQEKKIDTAGHYLKFVELKFEQAGKSHHWEAQWMSSDMGTKGDWFIIRVEMNRSCSVAHGE